MMTGILAVALAGCGQAAVDQEEMDAKTKEAEDAAGKNKGKGGGGAPGGPPHNK